MILELIVDLAKGKGKGFGLGVQFEHSS